MPFRPGWTRKVCPLSSQIGQGKNSPLDGHPRSVTILRSYAAGCGSAWLERLVRDQEVAGSNPVTPTSCKIEPFGENVEGLSIGGDLS
jgi:hypothetical protein